MTLTCHSCHGSTRCQLPIGHSGEHVGPKHLYLSAMPRVRWENNEATLEYFRKIGIEVIK